MEQPTKPAGYRVESIVLMESSFTRKTDINFDEVPFEHHLNVDKDASDVNVPNHFVVGLTLHFTAKQHGQVAYEIRVRMVGVFEQQGETQLTRDTFKDLNAPAIIYPFIREHVSSLTLKAGIGNVMLPAVNFKI